MEFKDLVCSKLKTVGDVKAKPMVGTHRIEIDGISLGVICTRMGDGGRWYLKKTAAGDAHIAANKMKLETGITGKSYIISNFADEKNICALAKVTLTELKANKGNV